MNRYYYDFHIHSCLSPCADNDMTPNNIAGVCALAGLQIAALTDHNSTKNCPAFFKAAKKQGISPIAGMELTTAEDIHVVCLFERLEDAITDVIRTMLQSHAGLVVLPIQDLLGYGADTRINTPGRAEGNWCYRTTREQLASIDPKKWLELNRLYSRI